MTKRACNRRTPSVKKGADRLTNRGGGSMRFRTKTAKEVRAMQEKMACSSTPEARSPLRVKFEANLYRWSEARTAEAERLANQLSIWTSSFQENVTLWTLVEERLTVISAKKNAVSVRRVPDLKARGGNIQVPIKRETPETVVEWLFESPTAEEWMYRFTKRF